MKKEKVIFAIYSRVRWLLVLRLRVRQRRPTLEGCKPLKRYKSMCGLCEEKTDQFSHLALGVQRRVVPLTVTLGGDFTPPIYSLIL